MTTAPVPVTGASELVLEVLDLERALRFYRDLLGFPLVESSEGRAWVMAGDRTRIGLWTPQLGLANGRGGLHVHFALNIDEHHFAAAVAGIRAGGEHVEVVAFDDDGRGRAAYVSDPDGNVVELWTWDVKGHLEQ